MLLTSYQIVDDVMNFKIFLESTSKGMADREKKEGKTKIQKLEYIKDEKNFLDEIKNIFLQFLKCYHFMKNKKLIKNSKRKL